MCWLLPELLVLEVLQLRLGLLQLSEASFDDGLGSQSAVHDWFGAADPDVHPGVRIQIRGGALGDELVVQFELAVLLGNGRVDPRFRFFVPLLALSEHRHVTAVMLGGLRLDRHGDNRGLVLLLLGRLESLLSPHLLCLALHLLDGEIHRCLPHGKDVCPIILEIVLSLHGIFALFEAA